MRKVIDYSLKCSWYCWVFIVLALLNFSPVANLLKYQIGADLFLCLLYMSPIILLFVSQFLHTIGIGSSISIVLMSGYLIYHGLNITIEAWEVFKPVIMSWDLFYIWDTLLMQTIDDMVYLGSGLLSLVASVGGIIYLIKNKDSFTFNMETRKFKSKKKHKKPFGNAKLATPKDLRKIITENGFALGLIPNAPIDTCDIEKSIAKIIKQKNGDLIKLLVVHIIVIATSRSGKGTGIIVPNIIDHDGGVFVLDPKPELVHITKRHRESINQKVHVFDPQNTSGHANCYINVLDFLDNSPYALGNSIPNII